jgi:hypothetical protein
MLGSLKTLAQTIASMDDKIDDRRTELDDVFLWLDKYVKAVFLSTAVDKKGDDLTVPLDAAFNIAITLMKIIDRGASGLDDKMAEELTKIKERYLGQ